MTHESYLSLFCENVKKLRSTQALSKKEMAKKLGIGTASLSAIESGTVPPRLSCDVLFEIYKNFGVLPEDLFTPHDM